MQSTLIIIRGNSGSGKTTIAQQLQKELGPDTMLISQDVIRRDILHTKDREGNPSIQLIQNIAIYGKEHCNHVIIEGILGNKNYQAMLHELITLFNNQAIVCYFDIPFAETLKRHQTKPNAHEFGVQKMQEWWLDKDYLGVPNEIIWTAQDTPTEILHSLHEQLKKPSQ
ncbi:kinase [Listeria booriae]|uniref:kinase n=1 Tax=Listeria booriae TaxID=1552123 RepID=UPI001624CF1E|nr:kinase [Listeria booriae]MBC1226513.1 kinase [Listeria booriae]MBC1284902.1 kinase [Listeria booriae]